MPRRNTGARFPHDVVIQLMIVTEMDPRTHQDLFDEDGISRETWRSWVTGRRSPGLDLLAKRAATLGKKIILTLADAPPTAPDRLT